jgi:hypothetical protein
MASWQERIRQDGIDAQRSGDQLQGYFQGNAEQADRQAQGYQQQLDQYRQQLMAEGYSPEEIEGILQREGYESLMFDGGEGNFLTQDEQAEIRGNPWAAKDAYDTRGLYSAVDRGGRNQRDSFQADSGMADTALDRMNEGYERGLAEAEFGPSGEYLGNMRGALGRGRGDVMDPLEGARGSVREEFDELGNRIGISDRFTDAMTVGDEEFGKITQAGANRLRAGQERMIQNAQRRAAEGGNVNALAVGAFEQDARREGAQDQIAAAIEGEVAARGVRRGAEDNLEKTRLAQETAGAGFRGRGIDTAVGLSRDMSQAGGDLMRAELDAEGQAEDRRFRGETAGLDARFRATGEMGQARLGEANQRRQGRAGIESQIADREWQNEDRNAMRRVDLEAQGEAAQQGRAAGLMSNNQQTRQYNQQTRYNQNRDIYDRNSQNQQQVANTRLNQFNRGGDVLAGQQQQQNQNAQAGYDRMGQQYQATQGARNQNNSTYANARSQPGFWGRMATAAVGAAVPVAAKFAGS